MKPGWIVDMEDIIFSGRKSENVKNQVNLLDANFFDFSDTKSEMYTVKQQVAKWYYILRNIAIGLSLLVLIYIGIRMAISAIAEEKARYKSMIKDWVIGFVLLFTLHFLMVAILNFNAMLVEIIYNAGGLSGQLGGYESALMKNMFSGSFIVGWGSILIVIIMFGMKIAFFWMYLKRVFTIGFLIVISPLITITYSIDRIGDGKSQALGTWMREFIYNLLIQPFHCIIYLVFVTAGISMLKTGALRGILFSCAGMLFIFKAEEIVKQIFGFGRAGSLGKLASAAAVTSLMSSSKSSGGGGESSSPAAGPVQGGAGGASGGAPGGNPGGRRTSGPGGGPGGAIGGPAGGTPAGAPAGASAGTPAGASAGASGGTSRLSNASTKNKIRSKLNQIKANPGQTAKGALGNAGLRAKALAAKGASKMAKAAPRLAGGLATAGLSGSVIAGYAASKKLTGGKFTRAISDPFDEMSAGYNAQIAANQAASMESALKDQEERDLLANVQNAYDDYRQWHPGEDISDQTGDFLDGNTDDAQGLAYAESLQQLKDFYGEDDPDGASDKVIGAVDDMILGKNKPVAKAVDNLMDNGSLKYQNEDKLANNTNAWMAAMDRSNQEQERIQREIEAERDPELKKQKQEEYKNASYLNSSEFESLDKDEKKLARQIYTAKTTLETQYNSAKVELPANGDIAAARQAQREGSRTRANTEIASVISKSYKRKKNT